MSAITLATPVGFRVIFPAVDAGGTGSKALVDLADKSEWHRKHIAEFDRWDMGWLMGRYVHADHANRNGHIFPLEDMKAKYPLVRHTPLNVLHRPREIIGHFAEVELLEPGQQSPAADGIIPPDPATAWVEAFAPVYRHIFPRMYGLIQKATARGVASLSMEAFPTRVGCETCGAVYDHDGPRSETYLCGHLDKVGAPKRLFEPHFVGGGVILPPARPGWQEASIKQVAALEDQKPDVAEDIRAGLAESWDLADDAALEEAMGAIVASADLVRTEEMKRIFQVPIAMAAELELDLTGVTPNDQVTAMAAELLDLMRPQLPAIPPLKPTVIPPTTYDFDFNTAPVTGLPMFQFPDGAIASYAAVKEFLAGRSTDVEPGTGAMVAIYPPTEVAAALAPFGTEPVEQLHITLAYFGKIAELQHSIDEYVDAVARAVESVKPIAARVSGMGTFRLEGDDAGTEATYASIDAPGVNALYERIAGTLRFNELEFATNHGFTPHLTLAYHEVDAGPTQMPPALSWPITEVHVVWGDDHTVIPFGDVSRA